MGREYSRVKLTIWNDPDFQALTYRAQWLYFVMLTHPTLNACGVLDWREPKLTHYASGITVRELRAAAYELGHGGFIAIDPDTEEALIRSFVRHDGGMKSPNMVKAIVRAHGGIASRKIKAIVSAEVRRAREEHPDWEAGAGAEPVSKQFTDEIVNPSDFVPDWFRNPSNFDSNGFDFDSNLIPLKEGNPFNFDSDPITHNPEPSTYVERGASSASAEDPTPTKRRSQKTRLPDNWQPNDTHHETAHRLHLNLDSEAEDFRNHAQAQGRRLVDWDAGFRSWLKKSAEYAQERQGRQGAYRNQAQILQDMRAQAAQATARRQATQGNRLRLIEGNTQ